MTCDVFSKRPADLLDYDVDFNKDKWLPPNDNIVQAQVTVDADSGIVLDHREFDATLVKVWLDAGTLGKTATVTVKVTTDEGREKEVVFKVRIEEGCT